MGNVRLAAAIAIRYLIAGKSHSAVSAIARVSVAGVAVATAAIVCVLSVFNGFREVLSDRLDTLCPDVIVEPAKGKTFANADSLAARIAAVQGVEIAMPSVTDQALLLAGSSEMPVTLKGVNPALYRQITGIDSIMLYDGRTPEPDSKEVAAAIGTAAQLGLYGTDVPMLLFAPRRTGRVNLANPAASFLTDSVTLSGVYRADQSEYDANTVVCDISIARDLFQYDTEASAIEVKAAPGTSTPDLARRIGETLGEGCSVKDRMQQQELNFRMVEIEKWITFLLLFFILVIASFNIISTMSMLVIEKRDSIRTFRAIGMSRRRIAAVFRWESMFVTLSGGVSGLILGVTLCMLQQHFGLIKLAGDPEAMIVSAYPVALEWTDVAISALPVILIGACTALIAGHEASRIARG